MQSHPAANGDMHDPDDSPASDFVRALAVLSVQVRDHHEATIDGIDRVGGDVRQMRRDMTALREDVTAIRVRLDERDETDGRILVMLAKLDQADSAHRSELASISNEVAETRDALSGLQLFGAWVKRHQAIGGFVTAVVIVLLQLAHLFFK